MEVTTGGPPHPGSCGRRGRRQDRADHQRRGGRRPRVMLAWSHEVESPPGTAW